MKKIFVLSAIIALTVWGCDKVDNAYPENTSGLDPALYPGDFSTYTPPTFSANTNTNRNVLIEDFTGHTCTFCPAAADLAHGLMTSNPGRVFVSTIHTGPNGANPSSGFQATNVAPYTYSFINAVSSEIGIFFGNLAGNNFTSNPAGNVSRIVGASTSITTDKNAWTDKTNLLLGANDLKVNIQSVVEYFPQTNGAYIHVEVDKLETIASELRLVVAFYEDSIVKPQTVFGAIPSPTVLDYVHRDLLKFHVNGGMNGEKIDDKSLNTEGTHMFAYSVKIPTEISADNAHLLIYVFDKSTQEIYQVIKKKFI
jgi:Outer membrane protein Omp28